MSTKQIYKIENLKNFSKIESENGQFKIWIKRADTKGCVLCTTSFKPKHQKGFIAALKELKYGMILEVHSYEHSIGYFVIQLTQDNSLTRLIEDLPELMYQNLK